MAGWYAAGPGSLHATSAALVVKKKVPTRCRKLKGFVLDPELPTAGVQRCLMCCVATGTRPGRGPGRPVATTVEPARGWNDRAACKGMPPEMFFVDATSPEGIEAARGMCLRCPVIEDCQLDAMNSDDVGVIRAARVWSRGGHSHPIRQCRFCGKWTTGYGFCNAHCSRLHAETQGASTLQAAT